MSVTGANSAPNSAASHISASQSPLQTQQQQGAGVPFPTYNINSDRPADERLIPDLHRVKSPSAVSNSASIHEPIRTASTSGLKSPDGRVDSGDISYMHQQQQQHILNAIDSRDISNPNPLPSNTSPFQHYGNANVGFPNGMGMEMGMGVGMEDIGKWIDGVGVGMVPNGLNGALAVGNTGPLSNLAAAAAEYANQQYAGSMSQADRQAWLAKSIFGGHHTHSQDGVGLNAMGIHAAMGMFNTSGQEQPQRDQKHHQQHQQQNHPNPQTYGLQMHNPFSPVNPAFHPYVPETMYANTPQPGSGPPSGVGTENTMGYQQGGFDIAGMNAALAGMHLAGLGEQGIQAGIGGRNPNGRPAALISTGTNHGPPSLSSGRGSMNSSSAPGSALSQLSAGSAGTGVTSFSSGSGAFAGNERGQNPINVNSANGRAMIGGLLDDDLKDVIPTAIVIKNIPFDVVKEKMLEVILSLGAPLPYAFNYHYENNQFRGLAFANFRQPFEADSVVAALNGYDLFGRKLRVEYKKVLQVGEKERIEKEKAIRRMKSAQLRNGPSGNTTPNSTNNPGFAAQQRPGMNGVPDLPSIGLGRTSGPGWHSRNIYGDSPNTINYASQYGQRPVMANLGSSYDESTHQTLRDQSSQSDSPPSSAHTDQQSSKADAAVKAQESVVRVDHTDPWTFDMHTRLVMFMADRATDETTFSSNLSAREKKIIHALAERLGLQHSDVEGRVIVGKVAANPAPGQPQGGRSTGRGQGAQSGTYLHPHAAGNSAPSLRNRISMPNLNGINTQASGHREPSRLLSRQSNQNLRDFALRTGNPHTTSSISHHQARRPFVSASGPALHGSQGFNSIFGSSMGHSAGSALEIVPSPTSPSDPTMPTNLALPSRGFAANRTSFRSRHGSTESARNPHASGVIGSQRPSSVNGIAPQNAPYRPDDRSGHTSGSSVIEEEETSGEDGGPREA